MPDNGELLNKIVTLKTTDGKVMFVGKAYGFHEHPTYVVKLPDGATMAWRADLCERRR
jgi:hypothetical protein